MTLSISTIMRDQTLWRSFIVPSNLGELVPKRFKQTLKKLLLPVDTFLSVYRLLPRKLMHIWMCWKMSSIPPRPHRVLGAGSSFGGALTVRDLQTRM